MLIIISDIKSIEQCIVITYIFSIIVLKFLFSCVLFLSHLNSLAPLKHKLKCIFFARDINYFFIVVPEFLEHVTWGKV